MCADMLLCAASAMTSRAAAGNLASVACATHAAKAPASGVPAVCPATSNSLDAGNLTGGGVILESF